MKKLLIGFVAGMALFSILGFTKGGGLMFNETLSPFGLDETVARIQRNVQETKGWPLVGLRSPSNSIRSEGAFVPNVVLVETCNTEYSKPILKEDETRILSILMPCKISVYEKSDGKVYIGTMNAGMLGWMFGPTVGKTMMKVAADQKRFLKFDHSRPTPKIVLPKKAGKSKGGGSGGIGGC